MIKPEIEIIRFSDSDVITTSMYNGLANSVSDYGSLNSVFDDPFLEGSVEGGGSDNTSGYGSLSGGFGDPLS